jgi:hypothetical protein
MMSCAIHSLSASSRNTGGLARSPKRISLNSRQPFRTQADARRPFTARAIRSALGCFDHQACPQMPHRTSARLLPA